MNLHDNRHATEEAVRRITDVGKLQNLAIGLLEMLAFMTAKRDKLLAERRARQAEQRRRIRPEVCYEVHARKCGRVAAYRRRAYALKYIDRAVRDGRFGQGDLAIYRIAIEP